MTEIKLTDLQLKKLDKIFNQHSDAHEFVTNVMVEAAIKFAKEKEEMWNQVAEICGYDSMIKMKMAGKSPKVKWLTGIIEVEDVGVHEDDT
jgi:hypothetical protein